MTDPDIHLKNNWNSSNVSRPPIYQFPYRNINMYKEGIIVDPTNVSDDYMGIIGRDWYSAESFDAWGTQIVSKSREQCDKYVAEIKRICAHFTPTGGDKILQWEGGKWIKTIPTRWIFELVLIVSL